MGTQNLSGYMQIALNQDKVRIMKLFCASVYVKLLLFSLNTVCYFILQ